MERRLVAIMMTDIVGYSRLMGLDEEGTVSRQKAHRDEVFDPKITQHGGRIVKSTGDGLLVEFSSVVDAVNCAIEAQRELAGCDSEVPTEKQVHYRIGINLGDIIIDGDDILGDGVNIAARLESLAEPGGICVSGNVHEQVKKRINVGFQDLGEQKLKNITDPTRAYKILMNYRKPKFSDAAGGGHLALPDKPSIAVLPFENLSGDPEQEYFADGMTEDIIAGLSKFHWLFVIARNSSFAYKGKSPDVRDVARDLGVRYVLEGSVRRGGTRLRITAQLIDAETGTHIWAERYDRELTDIFVVQDEVTAAIVANIAPEIGQSEIERMKRRPPENLDAWALFQQGMALYPSGAATDFQAAIALFDRARGLDTGFVEALVMAGHMRTRYASFFKPNNLDVLLEEAYELLQTAMRLDPRDATCHMALGRWHVIKGEAEIGVEYCQEALSLNPNSVLACFELGIALNNAGRYEESLEYYDTARRLSPRDLHAAALSTGPSMSLFMLGRYEEAAAGAARVSRSPNPRFWADAILVAALIRLGRHEEAADAKAVLLNRKPDFSIQDLASQTWSSREQFLSALREAGLPD